MDGRLIRALAALAAALLLLGAPLEAPAQTIPSSTFSALPGSAAPGTLRWVTDGACTPIPGTPEIGGGIHFDLVAYDATDLRWEFISRAPAGTTETDLPTFLTGSRISYDNATSGAAADDVQEALDELFAGGGGGGGGGGSTDLAAVAGPTSIAVSSSTGTDIVLVGASQSLAGLLTATDKLGIDLAAATIRYANPATVGTTTAGIQEAINSCGAGVGGGSVSRGCFVQTACDSGTAGRTITSTIVVGGDTLATAKSGVVINGCGPGYQNSLGQQTGGTALVWGGAAGANMIEFRTCNNCGIANLTLDGATLAARGLFYDSVPGWPTGHHRAFNLQLQDFTGAESIYLADSSQIDNGVWDHVSIRDSVGCFRQTYDQSVNNELAHIECKGTGTNPIELAAGELKIRDSFLSLSVPSQTAVKTGPAAILLAEGNSIEFKSSVGTAFAADASASSGGTNDASRIVGNRFLLIGSGGGNVCANWNRQGRLAFLDNSIIGIGAGADLGCDLIGDNSADADKLYIRSEGNSHRAVYVAGEFPHGAIDYGIVPWTITGKVVLQQLSNLGIPNPGGINHSTGLVDWTQLRSVPAGFADGSDDGSSGGATDLNGLTDVVLTTPATGSTLVFDGTNWLDGMLDLGDPDAVTGTLPDARVADNITANLYLPLLGGTLTGSLTLSSGQAINVPSGAVVQATGTGGIFATSYVGSGSVTSVVDFGTAEVSGINSIPNGGTGGNNWTNGGLLLGSGFGALRSTGVLAAGQLLIGDGTTDPTIAAMSGDATMTSGGVVSLATGVVDANELVSTGVTPGTYQNANVTVDADGRVTAITAGSSLLIGSGTKALSTTSIAAGACNTDSITAAGVVSTDVVVWSPNADISTVVGFRPISGDGLAIYPPVPGAGSITIKTCNPTASSITPGAVSLNWRVTR